MLVGDVDDLPSLDVLKRLFEGGRSEWEAWSEFSGQLVSIDA